MKKPLLIILIVIAGAALVWSVKNPKTTTTNGEFLRTGEGQMIASSSEAYFAGANGYYAHPLASGSFPGVVMIHENRGLNSGVRMMADELARRGYAVLAVDLLGKSVETQEEARGLTANYDQAKGTENLRAAAAFLRSKGSGKVASLGWCFGGGQSMQLALSGEKMDATIIYYGRLVTDKDQLSAITWPVLGIFGDKDTSIPATSAMAFEDVLNQIGVKNEIHIYPGVGHAFANPSGANYAPDETKDAWAKTLTFLSDTIGQ